MRARAHLVSFLVHVALALGQRVQDDEVEVDLLLAVPIDGFESVRAGVRHLGVVDDQSRRGATLVLVAQDRPRLARRHLAVLRMDPREFRRRF